MKVLIRDLGNQAYQSAWDAMRAFTLGRSQDTRDEIWFMEHPPVFTQGQAGKAEHILKSGNIPIVQTDRGGQVTYHGPGQLMVYLLVDIRRIQVNVREFVHLIEKTVIELLATYQVKAHRREHCPGVYVNEAKICSLGLRIRQGYSYHGLALNIDSDLTPFSQINPCGFKGLKMVNLTQYATKPTFREVKEKMVGHFISNLGYTEYEFMD